MDTILYFPRNQANEAVHSTKLAEIAARLGFNLQSGDVDASAAQARSFIRFWKPVGCVVNNDRLPVDVFRGIPSVFCHRDPKTLPPQSVLFSYDEDAIARLAVRELLQLNLASYCFVPDPSDEYWSRKREQGFLHAMEVNFKLKCSSVCPIRGKSLPQIQSSVATHLLKLPRPIGVFAANDATAKTVANACLHARLALPDDVALIGVDNVTAICERPDVSLSSIDFAPSADLETKIVALRELLSSRQRKAKIIHVMPSGVVRRASTARFARTDGDVQAAVELIRRRACDGLTANEVLGTFACSRRMAEMRFRAVTGHSVLDAIRDVRLSRAKALLAAGNLKASEIAARCGYRSWSSVFRLIAPKGMKLRRRTEP